MAWGPQHVSAHTRPGGQPADDEQARLSSQKTGWWQKQHPSTVTTQKQLHPPQEVCKLQAPQPPESTQILDAGALALAVAAVSIDPAPSAAAPTPALFSRPRLETRPSETAM